MRKFAAVLLVALVATYAAAGTITRGTKAGTGTTDFGSGTTISSSEVNTDFNNVYNEFNGNIEDANVDAAANIDPSKLGDYSASASEQKTEATPGTAGSESAATTMEGELSRLRYTTSRLAGVNGCEGQNASGAHTASWIEVPAKSANLIRNSGFFVDRDATWGDQDFPTGWTATGSISSTAIAYGSSMNHNQWSVQAGAANGGYTYTLSELRASKKYLIVINAQVSSGTLAITTTGADAASQWRNVSDTTTTAAATTYCYIVQNDSTPTDIVLLMRASGAAADWIVNEVGVWELSDDNIAQGTYYSIARDTDSSEATAAAVSDNDSDANTGVYVPDKGHVVRVTGYGSCQTTSAGTGVLTIDLKKGSTVLESMTVVSDSPNTVRLPYNMLAIDTAPAQGTVEYKITFSAATADWSCVGNVLYLEALPL